MEAELILTPNPSLLARPVVVINADNMKAMQGDIAQALSVEVKDADQFKSAAHLLNFMGKVAKLTKEKALELGRPFRDESAAITAKAEEALAPYRAAYSHLQDAMKVYSDKVEADNQAALEEARKLAEKNMKEGNLDGAENALTAAVSTLQEAPIAKGIKAKETAVIISFDLAKLPIAYHMLDEAKLKKSILANIVTLETPGVVFKIEKSFTGTGR